MSEEISDFKKTYILYENNSKRLMTKMNQSFADGDARTMQHGTNWTME